MSIPRSRDFRLLAGAAGLSALGDFMAIFPLILHVQQQHRLRLWPSRR